MHQTIAFIGGGNMGRSLIGGMIARGQSPAHIIAADPVAAQLGLLRDQYSIRVTPSNTEAAQSADVLILAVKPQEMRTVVSGLAAHLSKRPLIISVAAGIRASDIQRWAGGLAVVRCMPNRPALQGCGVTGLFATAEVPAEGKRRAEEILSAVGPTIWVEHESQMDAVTAVSGSGPAYFFLLIEMMEQAGVELGLPPHVSRTLAIETAYGSGRMARECAESPAVLREQVTSKGGTTEAALKHLEAHHVRQLFSEALAAAAKRSQELAELFGKSG